MTPKVLNKYKHQKIISVEPSIYIMRGGIYGNPFEIGKDGTRDDVCDKFYAWIKTGESFNNVEANKVRRTMILDNIDYLKGKNLICCCKDDKKEFRCHGDTLIKLANPELYLDSNGLKVIIAGGRNITDYDYLLDAIKKSGFSISEIVCGKAKGVDSMGEQYSISNNIPVIPFPAIWEVNGVVDKGAGFKRNQQMADYADALILIYNGHSKGSSDMLQRAKKKGLKIFVYLVEDTTTNN